MSLRDYPAHEPARPRRLDGLRRRPVAEVAAQLGVAIVHGRMTCPACGVEGRACSVNPDGMGWRCWACDARGDALVLAGYVVCGRRPTKGDAAAWEAVSVALGGPRLDVPAPKPQPVRPLVRPPGVADVWDACGRVDDDREVSAWVRSRGLDPVRLARRDILRALPRGRREAWLPPGRRAVFAGRDALGDVVTLRFRGTLPKTRPPYEAGKHYDTVGAVLACPIGWALLCGIVPERWDGRLIVAEGEPDFATVAQNNPDSATWAVWSGSWTAAIAARVPEGAAVTIATHHDKGGEKYAALVRGSLERRCGVTRTAPGPDENDRWMARNPEQLAAK